MTTKIAILISGRGSNMATIIEAQRAGKIPGEIVLVLSNKDGAGGLALAKQAGIPTAVVASKGKSRAEFEKGVQTALEEAGADFVCLAGFMRVLSEDFVVRWNGRMLNIHPSLLPLFRGLHVHEQAIEAKVAVSGCTVHYVTPELDGGPIVGQAVVPVKAEDTPDTLAARVQKAEHLLYPAALAKCLGGEPEWDVQPGILLSLR
ncbi:phosphoribosylglycinamide formyltransferase [Parvularcula lutaonensis]|uniref:Phosphoribosylglycinamide formyltransferase n=1 Tax=Parvularcula lutaonensis TaxID=491923 RepID=A0ABV7MDC2_9PROT|nr:phosphoribosylglycinamide formyltransferase [Parvularcula lutaonensis]GGY39544.1 phosphoribosylglycinamide formyltransferase [Parvularcula lutaonensis]